MRRRRTGGWVVLNADERVQSYLREVAARLSGSRAHRERIVAELAVDVDDAVAAHEHAGLDHVSAVERALADFGPAADVAAGFAGVANAPRPIRGFRRWVPLGLPGLMFATFLFTFVQNGSDWVEGDATRAETFVLRYFVWTILLYGVLTVLAVAAIRRADRDRAWRIVAWVPSVLVLLPIVRGLVLAL